VFVPGRSFQLSLMFAGKAGTYPTIKHLKGALVGKVLALPTNIRLGCRALPGTSTLAFYKNLNITAVKLFITMGPGPM
jgi:hypothetical protein